MNEHAYTRTPVRAVTQLRALSQVVVRDITKVTQPALIMTSVDDHVVHPTNSQWLAEHIASTDTSSIALLDSYHVATLDHDAQLVFDASLAFVRRIVEG